MRIAYIVGPYRAETYQRRQENIAKAAIVAKEFWKRDFAVICPHMNSANFDGLIPDDSFLQGGLDFLLHLNPGTLKDVVVAMPGWMSSQGSRAELQMAKDLRLEIIYLTEDEYATFTN